MGSAALTYRPLSLSSIQCLGALSRFKCFLGPLTYKIKAYQHKSKTYLATLNYCVLDTFGYFYTLTTHHLFFVEGTHSVQMRMRSLLLHWAAEVTTEVVTYKMNYLRDGEYISTLVNIH